MWLKTPNRPQLFRRDRETWNLFVFDRTSCFISSSCVVVFKTQSDDERRASNKCIVWKFSLFLLLCLLSVHLCLCVIVRVDTGVLKAEQSVTRCVSSKTLLQICWQSVLAGASAHVSPVSGSSATQFLQRGSVLLPASCPDLGKILSHPALPAVPPMSSGGLPDLLRLPSRPEVALRFPALFTAQADRIRCGPAGLMFPSSLPDNTLPEISHLSVCVCTWFHL